MKPIIRKLGMIVLMLLSSLTGLTNVVGSECLEYHTSAASKEAYVTGICYPINPPIIIPPKVFLRGDWYTVIGIMNCHKNGYSAENIYIPKTIKSISSGAFSQCSSKIHVEDLDSWCGISFGSKWHCVIGNYEDSNKWDLFVNDQLVTDLELPEELSKIEKYTFEGCRSICKIKWPRSLKYIEDYAFNNCENLSTIIPTTVTSLFPNSFNGVKQVACPEKLYSEYSHHYIYYPPNAKIESNIIYRDDKLYFVQCDIVGSYSVPDNISSIEPNCFRNCDSLAELILPYGLQTISEYAFENCTSLTEINLPDGLQTIGEYAFKNCNSLTSVDIPKSVTSADMNAFSGCESLRLVKTKFGDLSSLSSLSNLESVILYDGTKECKGIGKNVNTIYSLSKIPPLADEKSFLCDKTIKVYIPKGALTAYSHVDGWNRFNNLIEVSDWCDFEINNSYDVMLDEDARLEDRIPSYSIPLVEALTISGFITIDDIKFLKGMKHLKILNLENAEIDDISLLKLAELSNLATLVLPKQDNLKIPTEAFANYINLQEIHDFPNIETIPEGCFKGCSSLKILDLPERLTRIEAEAFSGCSSLNVSIPPTVQYIGEKAFAECNFEELIIPASVLEIGNEAFNDCNIKRLIIEDSDVAITLGHGTQKSLIETYSGSSPEYDNLFFYSDIYNPLFFSEIMNYAYIGRNFDIKKVYDLFEQIGVNYLKKTNTLYYLPIGYMESLREVEIGDKVTDLGPDKPISFKISRFDESTYEPGNFFCNLRSVISHASIPPTGVRFNEYTLANADLVVPEDAVEVYKTAPIWKNFQRVNYIYANDITINHNKVNAEVGDWVELKATVFPENANLKDVNWHSSDDSVAKVFDDGWVQCVSDGRAIITATAKDESNVTASCVFVIGNYIEPEAIAFAEAAYSVEVGEELLLNVIVSPMETTNKTIVWNSSDNEVASVSNDGVVKGLSIGTAVITAELDDASANCEVEVTEKNGVLQVRVTPTEIDRHDLMGRLVDASYHGLVIVRCADGSARKIMQ